MLLVRWETLEGAPRFIDAGYPELLSLKSRAKAVDVGGVGGGESLLGTIGFVSGSSSGV